MGRELLETILKVFLHMCEERSIIPSKGPLHKRKRMSINNENSQMVAERPGCKKGNCLLMVKIFVLLNCSTPYTCFQCPRISFLSKGPCLSSTNK